jgi:hypothetical protein
MSFKINPDNKKGFAAVIKQEPMNFENIDKVFDFAETAIRSEDGGYLDDGYSVSITSEKHGQTHGMLYNSNLGPAYNKPFVAGKKASTSKGKK